MNKKAISESIKTAQETLRPRQNYNRWIYESVRTHIGERVLEVGCGIGNITQFMRFKELVYGIDISREMLGMINQKCGKLTNFKSSRFDIEKDDVGKLMGNDFDTVICLNVIEHLADDVAALKKMYSLLEKKGRLALLVPAYQWLYGSMDKSHGHMRRYNKKGLTGKLGKAGFRIERMFFINMPGVFGWFLNGKVLKRRHLPEKQTLLFDMLVPLFKAFETIFNPFFGLSVICICRKNIR